MLITRTSPFSGKIHSIDIPVSQAQYESWESGVPIQMAMAGVSAEHREFIMTGITPEEWREAFGDEDEE